VTTLLWRRGIIARETVWRQLARQANNKRAYQHEISGVAVVDGAALNEMTSGIIKANQRKRYNDIVAYGGTSSMAYRMAWRENGCVSLCVAARSAAARNRASRRKKWRHRKYQKAKEQYRKQRHRRNRGVKPGAGIISMASWRINNISGIIINVTHQRNGVAAAVSSAASSVKEEAASKAGVTAQAKSGRQRNNQSASACRKSERK